MQQKRIDVCYYLQRFTSKSLIVYLLVRFNILRLKEQNKKILIIVPTTSLVEQLTKDFGDYVGI